MIMKIKKRKNLPIGWILPFLRIISTEMAKFIWIPRITGNLPISIFNVLLQIPQLLLPTMLTKLVIGCGKETTSALFAVRFLRKLRK